MVYTSLDNDKIKDIKKLHQSKYRNMHNVFLVEGIHLVEEAYKKGLRLNDVVTKLNNKAIADLSQKEIDTIISNKNNKLLISTELQDIQITLKELIK